MLVRTEDFWKRANSNFLDIAVLEWCKLFADAKADHCWRKVLSDPSGFETVLLAQLNISKSDMEDYCLGMRTYRDKFVAHLDENAKAKYPILDLAVESTKFLYNHLLTNEDRGGYFIGLAHRPESAYRVTLNDAKKHYQTRNPNSVVGRQ